MDDPWKCEILRMARDWIGTPYRHQCSTKGQGTDCLGLLRGVWRDLNGAEPELAPPYTADWSEPLGQERLWTAAARHLLSTEISPQAAGDVVLFRMAAGTVAKHLGILGGDAVGYPTLIHAYERAGVVETPLTQGWRRRIVAQFEIPDRRR